MAPIRGSHLLFKNYVVYLSKGEMEWQGIHGIGACVERNSIVRRDTLFAYRARRKRERMLSDEISPKHYSQFKIEPFDFIHENGLGFAEGNVIKYVCRWREKNGIEDLEKAMRYIQLLIVYANIEKEKNETEY